jgi:hypothetical protein
LPLATFGQGLPKTEKIQIIESKDSKFATNLIQSAAPKDRSRQLEDLLTEPSQGMSTKGGSLDPVMMPPPRIPIAGPAIQSPRAKALLDQRKNWYLMSPEDLAGGPKAKDALDSSPFGSDGRDKDKETTLERYFRRLDQPKQKNSRSAWPGDEDQTSARREKNPGDRDASRDDTALPTTLRESERDLKKLSEDDSSSSMRSSLSDLFAPNSESIADKAKELAHKNFMEDYKKLILGGSASPMNQLNPLNPLSPTKPVGSMNPLAASPIDSLAVPWSAQGGMDTSLPTVAKPTGGNELSGVLNPRLSGPKLPDLNGQTFNQWNPLQQEPRVDLPTTSRAVTPIMSSLPDFPRRKF